MNTKSLWSGGVEWGTAVTARAAGYWQPDGATPTGKPFPDVAVGGELITTSNLMSASWSLGVTDYLADLAPNSASITCKGQLSASIGDDLVISTGLSCMFSGSVDNIAETRDTAGNHWTTVTGTDRVGALSAARLRKSKGVNGTLEGIIETMSKRSGITVNVSDVSAGAVGLISLNWWPTWNQTFTGTLLEYIIIAQRSSNAMLALQPDGSIRAMTREAITSYSPTSLTGSNAPASWTKTTSWDGYVNRWTFTSPNPGEDEMNVNIADDIRLHGERAFAIDNWLEAGGGGRAAAFADWFAYTPTARAVVTDGQFIVSDFSQSGLLTLAPLDWVTVFGEDWQVMSMTWNVDGPGQPMRLTITADDILLRISDITNGGGGGGPTISNVASSELLDTTATISWDLDQPGTGYVEYGLTTSYGLESIRETSYTWNYHVQHLSGLLPATTYHYRVRSAAPSSAPIETISGDYTFTTTSAGSGGGSPGGGTSPTPSTFYGARTDNDGLANTTFGSSISKQTMRFRAWWDGARIGDTDTLKSFRFYYLTNVPGNPGYGIGTGGTWSFQIQTDDGSPDHLPTGNRIGAVSDFPAVATYDAARLITLAGPLPQLVAGTIYHAVFTITDASPGSNNFSTDHGWLAAASVDHPPNGAPGEWNPGIPYSDLGHAYYEASSGWTIREGFNPIFEAYLTGGKSFGNGAFEAAYGGTDRHAKIDGSGTGYKGRQKITVTGSASRVVTKVGVRAHKIAGSTGAMTIQLCDSSMSVLTSATIAAASFPDDVDPGSSYGGEAAEFVEATFGASQTLNVGSVYYIVLSTTAASTFFVFGFRHGIAYGYTAVTRAFNGDGYGQLSTDNGSTWSDVLTYGGDAQQVDLHLYLA